jgi:hypothetical protein
LRIRIILGLIEKLSLQMRKKQILIIGFIASISFTIYAQHKSANNLSVESNPAKVFENPPESAKPGVLWMWMGSNISKEGITLDLEALKKAGFNRATMFSLADITTPWAGEIKNSLTPELISWTEPWWKLVHHAAEESKRLGIDFGMFNGPGYESSGGPWITPELSMQEICWSKTDVIGNSQLSLHLERPQVDLRANMMWPVYNPETNLLEKPLMQARKTYYNDIVVLAAPSAGVISKDSIINLTDKMQPDGQLKWSAPKGLWTIYRIGHTSMGAIIQPAQWKATGLECDKMSQEAVNFHIDHVINEINKHLGDLIGTGFTHVHFDSYEAGVPTWTPKMRQEFLSRRGYDLLPYLLTFAGRNIGGKEDSLKFRNDFDATIKDLYRDIYFATLQRKLHEANLEFLCEPYGGPWRQEDIMSLIDRVMTEFWTNNGEYTPYELEQTVAALRNSGQNIIEAEAFTGHPEDSKWSETPQSLKPIGDAAFCAGVNRLVLHRFVQQPWDKRFLPGATMGQWGTHFDRTQTWWNDFNAMVKYWQRCQSLLQWGKIATNVQNDFDIVKNQGKIKVKSIHRTNNEAEIYFVANTSHNKGSATCVFKVSSRQPELWNPVTGEMRNLPEFSDSMGYTTIPLVFDEAQSFFIVFRKDLRDKLSVGKRNFLPTREIALINQPWQVQFDSVWGGPAKSITFTTLVDWTNRPEVGIKYYSGTAVYSTSFDVTISKFPGEKSDIYLDLGVVKHIAHVFLNNTDLGVVWTAPWSVKLPASLLKKENNKLEIRITNVWANRLIGDKHESDDCEWLNGYEGGRFLERFPEWFYQNKTRPSKERYCFTTWDYFTVDSPLISSGLIGPVRIIENE